MFPEEHCTSSDTVGLLQTNDVLCSVFCQLITAMMTDTERIEQAVEAIRIFSVAPYLVLTLIYLSLVVGPVSLLPFAVYILNACFTVGRIRVDFTNISVVFHVDGLEIKT